MSTKKSGRSTSAPGSRKNSAAVGSNVDSGVVASTPIVAQAQSGGSAQPVQAVVVAAENINSNSNQVQLNKPQALALESGSNSGPERGSINGINHYNMEQFNKSRAGPQHQSDSGSDSDLDEDELNQLLSSNLKFSEVKDLLMYKIMRKMALSGNKNRATTSINMSLIPLLDKDNYK